MFKCKAICEITEEYRQASHRVEGFSVKNGFKRCTICGIITNSIDLRCKCCGSKFKIRALS